MVSSSSSSTWRSLGISRTRAPQTSDRPRAQAPPRAKVTASGEGAHTLGRGEGDLLGDRPTHRDAEQVEVLDLQAVGERQGVAGHVGHLVLTRHVGGLPHVAVVEDHRLVALREGGQLERPSERVDGEAVNAEQRLALAVHLVVELAVVEIESRHRAILSHGE